MFGKHSIFVLLVVFSIVPYAAVADAPQPPAASNTAESGQLEFDAKRFYSDLRQIVRRHYREATSHHLKNKLHFEHDTRIFIVHIALKTGEWQDPWEERGPKKNGIYCDIEFRKGKYMGAAALPQSFDRRYFTVHVLAPYSEKFDGYLYIHLKTPNNGKLPEGFMQQVMELFNGFERYAKNE